MLRILTILLLTALIISKEAVFFTPIQTNNKSIGLRKYIEFYPPEHHFSAQFYSDLEKYCSELKIQKNWLLIVIFHESKYNTKALNKKTNAVGLIQFMPSTLKQWNITITEFQELEDFEQLKYIYLYLKKIKYTFTNPCQLQLAIFLPKYLPYYYNDDFVFGSEISESRAKIIRNYNPPNDLNNDGFINMSEFKQKFINFLNDYNIVSY